MIVFTSVCSNYGHKARVLAHSVHEHIPDAQVFLCLTEREVPESLAADSCFDRILLSKDIWEGNFDRFIFKHSIVEASTAVKGAFFHWLQRQYPREEAFVYLDPDCCVYSDFPEIRESLREVPAVLCPHLLHPGNIDMELSSTAHGVYNLGFLAVNNTKEAREIIDWWKERLFLYCYDDIPNGIFTDQKWMDLAPCFFNVKILRHYGYDLAPWGILHTSVEKENGNWTVQGMPLRFVHYSGFGPVAEMCMTKWGDKRNAGFAELYADYAKVHQEMDRDGISQTPWSYDTYHSGEKISRTIREAYRKNWELMNSQDDPFGQSNEYFVRKLGIKYPDDVPPRNGFGILARKWHTASDLMKEQGMRGVTQRIAERMRGQRE